jgi:hypothetical protein
MLEGQHKLCYNAFVIPRNKECFIVLSKTPRYIGESFIKYKETLYYHGFAPTQNSHEVRYFLPDTLEKKDFFSVVPFNGQTPTEFSYGLNLLETAAELGRNLLESNQELYKEFLFELNFGDLASSKKFNTYGTILVELDKFEVGDGSDWLEIKLPENVLYPFKHLRC